MGPLLSVCAAAWATHRSAPPNAGNLKAHASPADEIKQMLWVLWHLMKQLEVFQKTGGLLASSPPTCFWCRGRLRDVQIFIKESVTQRSNPLWRAAESGHLNLRQRQQRGFCMVQCKLKYNDVSPKKKKGKWELIMRHILFVEEVWDMQLMTLEFQPIYLQMDIFIVSHSAKWKQMKRENTSDWTPLSFCCHSHNISYLLPNWNCLFPHPGF